jgi:hypothetical protein
MTLPFYGILSLQRTGALLAGGNPADERGSMATVVVIFLFLSQNIFPLRKEFSVSMAPENNSDSILLRLWPWVAMFCLLITMLSAVATAIMSTL